VARGFPAPERGRTRRASPADVQGAGFAIVDLRDLSVLAVGHSRQSVRPTKIAVGPPGT